MDDAAGTTPTRATAASTQIDDQRQQLQVAFTFTSGTPQGQESAIVVGDTLYFVTPYPEQPLCDRPSPKPAATEVEVRSKPAAAVAGRPAASRQSRPGLFERPVYLQRARRAHARGRCRDRQIVEDPRRRFHRGRDHHHGAARGEGQGAGRQFRRGVRRARLADGSQRLRRSIAWRAYTTGPDKDVLIGPRVQAVLSAIRGRTSACRPGRRGVEDRRRHGVGLDLLRPRARSHLLRHSNPGPVESRGSGPAKTTGPTASSRAIPTRARRAGSINTRRTISGIIRRVNENLMLDLTWRASRAR